MKREILAGLVLLAAGWTSAQASTFTVTVDGTDAIFLAGRTDLMATQPPANQAWADGSSATDDGLLRHGGTTPEEALETAPPSLAVTGGDVVRVLDIAVGGINFFNGSAGGLFGPAGNGGSGSSNLTSLGGISGYQGTQGALTGVFLDDAIPSLANGLPPATLTLADYGGTLDFGSLAPAIGQVFYIGDGSTSGGGFKQFVAPTGATRVFFGIPDGFGFGGVPGAYDDNDGSYQIRVGINSIPTPSVPLPAGAWLLLGGLGILAAARRKSAQA